ncbi:MAG: SUMF1/EgtB/PvdO family nonheme iron enzyme, partial [Planctomycetes bacterium]|nr:SUMF1/EgtB/PvdO family nonheme iron enzyme [Planctomycetota bacterium]
GDLDWITLRCLEKDRTRRYQSASELAADLQRHLDCEPVEAGPPSTAYRVRKFLRKRRGAVAAAAALLLALAGGTAVSLWQAKIARDAEQKERGARLDEERQRKRAQSAETRVRATAAQLTQRTAEFERLKGVVILARARKATARLDPPWPDKLPAIAAWQAKDGKRLLALRSELESVVTEVRKRARPWSDAERRRDRAAHPELAELAQLPRALLAVERAADVWAHRRTVSRPELPAQLAAAKAGVLVYEAFMRTARPSFPGRTIYGEEPFGLAAAELALQKRKAGDGSISIESAYNNLIMALRENGLHDEADRRVQEMLPFVPEAQRARSLAGAQRYAEYAKNGAARSATLRERIAQLEQRVSTRSTWSFPTDADKFLHDMLVSLIQDIRSFERKEIVEVGLRRRWADGLAELERDPAYRKRWKDAHDDLAASIPGFDLPVQHGLVPIGKNAKSGMWEFYHLRSAWSALPDVTPAQIPVPTRADYDEHGGLRPTDRLAGIVFVLLPGGTFTIGAQDNDPLGLHYDPEGSRTEGWPQPVTLAPFFLAKHEVTQGQWAALAQGEAPSSHQVGYGQQGTEHRITWQNPVERVTWRMADDLATRFGLRVPTEAQWEYA